MNPLYDINKQKERTIEIRDVFQCEQRGTL